MFHQLFYGENFLNFVQYVEKKDLLDDCDKLLMNFYSN